MVPTLLELGSIPRSLLGQKRVRPGCRQATPRPGSVAGPRQSGKADLRPACADFETQGPDGQGQKLTCTPFCFWAPGNLVSGQLTIVRHAQCQAFLEAAVLALVAVLLLDFADPLTFLIFQLHADRPAEEALRECRCVRKRKTTRKGERLRLQPCLLGCTQGLDYTLR